MSDQPTFYMDEHIPPQVTKALQRLGVDVRTTKDAGFLGKSDPEQLALAASEGCILVTQNAKDFIPLHEAGTPHAGILIANGKVTISMYIKALKLVAGASRSEDWIGTLDSIAVLASYD